MTKNSQLSEAELEALFDAAATDGPAPSESLLAAIMDDADNELLLRAQRKVPSGSVRNWRSRMFGAIGGWPAAAGLAMATVAGIWIGYVSPDQLLGISDGLMDSVGLYDLGDLMPTYDDLTGEG